MQTCPGFFLKSLLESAGNLLEICSVKFVDTLRLWRSVNLDFYNSLISKDSRWVHWRRLANVQPGNIRETTLKTDVLWYTVLYVVLCDTWNWSDDNDTASGIEYHDTGNGNELCNFNVVQNSQVSVHRHQYAMAVIFIQEIVLIPSRFM